MTTYLRFGENINAKDGSYSGDLQFEIMVSGSASEAEYMAGDIVGGTPPRMIKGSWNSSDLPSGNKQIVFRVLVDQYSVTALPEIMRFFAAIDQQREREEFNSIFYVSQQIQLGSDESFSYARVVGGTIEPVDDVVLTRWQERGDGKGEWIISFERSMWLETPLAVAETDSRRLLNATGSEWPRGNGIVTNPVANMALYGLYGGGRWRRTRIQVSSKNKNARWGRAWFGIKEYDGRAGAWNPRIEIKNSIDVDIQDGGDITSVAERWDNYGHGEASSSYAVINWNRSGVKDEWRRRFLIPAGKWNTTNKSLTNQQLYHSLRGRYRLLMRYRTNQRLKNTTAQTGIKAIGVWYGHAVPQVWEGEEHWINHYDTHWRWLDMGEFSIAAGQRIDPDYFLVTNSFSIGIDAMSLNIPDRVNSNNTGIAYWTDTNPGQDYAIVIERFHLIPADNYLHIDVPGEGGILAERGLVNVYMDDEGEVYAYGSNDISNAGGWFDVTGVEHNRWGVPIGQNAYLTGVVERGVPVSLESDYIVGYDTSVSPNARHGGEITITFDGAARTKYEWQGSVRAS